MSYAKRFLQQRPLFLLLLGCFLIFTWQLSFRLQASDLDSTYRLRASSGLKYQDYEPFAYFYYYLGLFPVATTLESPPYSKEGAQSVLDNHPDTLRMETTNVIRTGDFGRIWLFMPDAILKDRPEQLRIWWFQAGVFVVALSSLLIASWVSHQLVLGILLVVLIGSHPFQVYEVYGNQNLFGWPISITTFVLALHFPLLFHKHVPRGWLWILPIFSGLLLATVRQIRTEPMLIIASVFAVYIVALHLTWKTRALLCLALLGSFYVGSKGYEYRFSKQFLHAREVVLEHGGDVLPKIAHQYHLLWHPIWCGLGDFDTTYGYAWDDRDAYEYATPIMKERGVLDFTMKPDSYVESTATHDDNGKYYKLIWELPEYEEVMKEKVVHDIMHDPLWYLNILRKRVHRILTEVAPVRIAIGDMFLSFPVNGYLLFPTILLLAVRRHWGLLKIVIFPLPLALTAFLIFSGRGTTYYSIYPHVMVAVYGALLWGWAVSRYRGNKPQEEAQELSA